MVPLEQKSRHMRFMMLHDSCFYVHFKVCTLRSCFCRHQTFRVCNLRLRCTWAVGWDFTETSHSFSARSFERCCSSCASYQYLVVKWYLQSSLGFLASCWAFGFMFEVLHSWHGSLWKMDSVWLGCDLFSCVSSVKDRASTRSPGMLSSKIDFCID